MNRFRQFWSAQPFGYAALACLLAVAATAAAGIQTLAGLGETPPARVMQAPPRVAPPKPVKPQPKPAPPKPTVPAEPSAFALEERMTTAQRMKRWDTFVLDASKRFHVPQAWIRAVIMAESAGRTMLGEGQPIVSRAGAMGLMQLMPATYADMRRQHGLGGDPFDPHDNILAGTAYLHFLHGRYGYPAMFAAYNDGPGHLDERIANERLLPTETIVYVERITGRLEGHGGLVKFTRPDGSPVLLDGAAVRSVRAALPGEYAPGVRSVITVGAVQQGVQENLATAKAIILARGGSTGAKTRLVTRVVLSCAREGTVTDAGRITCSRGPSR